MTATPRARVDAAPQPIERAQIAAVAAALAQSFRDNAGFRGTLRGLDDDRREAKIRRVFGSCVAACVGHGDATAIVDADGAIAGAALAYPPGAYPWPLRAWLRNGLGSLTVGPAHTLRLARLDSYMGKHHLRTPHWYLYVLGVDPAHQGTGCGGRLLARLGERADAAHVDSYLETDEERNVGLYRRYGYDVIAEGDTPVGFHMWHMLRPAR